MHWYRDGIACHLRKTVAIAAPLERQMNFLKRLKYGA